MRCFFSWKTAREREILGKNIEAEEEFHAHFLGPSFFLRATRNYSFLTPYAACTIFSSTSRERKKKSKGLLRIYPERITPSRNNKDLFFSLWEKKDDVPFVVWFLSPDHASLNGVFNRNKERKSRMEERKKELGLNSREQQLATVVETNVLGKRTNNGGQFCSEESRAKLLATVHTRRRRIVTCEKRSMLNPPIFFFLCRVIANTWKSFLCWSDPVAKRRIKEAGRQF